MLKIRQINIFHSTIIPSRSIPINKHGHLWVYYFCSLAYLVSRRAIFIEDSSPMSFLGKQGIIPNIVNLVWTFFFFPSFIHLVSIHWRPDVFLGTFLGIRDIRYKNNARNFCPLGLCILLGEANNRQLNYCMHLKYHLLLWKSINQVKGLMSDYLIILHFHGKILWEGDIWIDM